MASLALMDRVRKLAAHFSWHLYKPSPAVSQVKRRCSSILRHVSCPCLHASTSSTSSKRS